MTTRKNYNSVIFLTTLSVYLGLVLVGATPQISAQTLRKTDEANKISVLVPGEGLIFTFDLNPLIKLSRLSANESLPVKISGKLFDSQQKFTDWKITETGGSQPFVNFLRKEFFAPATGNIPSDSLITKLFPKEISQSVEVSKDAVAITRNLTFDAVKNAVEMAEIYRRMIEYAKSPAAKKEVAGNLYLTNTEVRVENNQVFIVTRLPRGSLDALLAKDGAK